MTKGDIMAENGMTWFDLFDTPEKRISFAKSAADQMMVQMKDENMTIHHWCSEKRKEYTNEETIGIHFTFNPRMQRLYPKVHCTKS